MSSIHVFLAAGHPALYHLTAILFLFFGTFARVLSKDYTWVIDDIEGIARFSERFVQEKNPKGEVTKEYVLDSYDIDDPSKVSPRLDSVTPPKTTKTVKLLSFIPELGFPGCVLRFIRLQIGKKYQVIGTNAKGHPVWGYVQSPRRHHLISMAVQAVNLVLAYLWLRLYIGRDLAFAACMLYAVHPLTTQTVGWISGLSYSLSMVFALAVLNTNAYFHDYHLTIPLTVFFSFLSGIVLYTGCFTWVVLLFLGFKWAAFASSIIGLFILFWKGTETKNFRTKSFKDQNMDHTTFLNWRKPIVMLKTLYYYLPHVLFPVRLGLYHEWGYFYEDPMERMNGMFWRGLVVAALTVWAWAVGGATVQLGLVWFIAYFFLFSNFITAQQFVADRYVAIPAFGIAVILAKLLYPTPFFWLLVGLYAMRTFDHLPTFRNEIDYFLSNFLNFRRSEVALGNLGVAYMNSGMPGAAVDMWSLSTRINPHYDVAWYNLFSIFKANNRIPEATESLKKCLNAKVVHFKDRWEKEYAELTAASNNKTAQEKVFTDAFNEAKMYFDSGNTIQEQTILKKIIDMSTGGLIPQWLPGVQQRYAEIQAMGTAPPSLAS